MTLKLRCIEFASGGISVPQSHKINNKHDHHQSQLTIQSLYIVCFLIFILGLHP